MPDPVRFTPDEIRELAAAGALTPEDIATMHPSDRAVASMEMNKGQYGKPYEDFDINKEGLFGGRPARTPMPDMKQAAVAGAGVAAGAGGLNAPTAVGAGWGAMPEWLKAIAGISAVQAVPGIPQHVKSAIETGLGFRMALAGGKAPKAGTTIQSGGGAVAAETAEQAAIRAQMSKQGYPPALIDRVIAKDAGKIPMAPKGAPRPVSRTPPDYSDISENVQRGVQNDFRGRVTFQNPTKGVGPKGSSFDDIKEQVTGSSRMGWEDPRGTALGYGDSANEPTINALRELIREQMAAAKSPKPSGTKRRTPKK